MLERIMWPVLAIVLLTAVGCAAETLPPPDAPQEGASTKEATAETIEIDTPTADPQEEDTVTVEPTAEPTETDTPTADPQEEDTVTIEPTAEPTETDTPTAEALQEILESELLETPDLSATVTPLLEEVPQLELNPVKPGPEQKLHIAFAKRDLSERLGVEIGDIEVTAYETITWSDGSLGCPQPGMMYTQALIDGYVIQLVVDGEAYNYHGANGRDPFLCIRDGGESGGIERGGFLATPPPSDEDV